MPIARQGDDVLRHKLDVLRGHCEAVGRPYEEIERTLLDNVNLSGDDTPASVIESCRKLADLGIQHVIFGLRDVHELKSIETLGARLFQQWRIFEAVVRALRRQT